MVQMELGSLWLQVCSKAPAPVLKVWGFLPLAIVTGWGMNQTDAVSANPGARDGPRPDQQKHLHPLAVWWWLRVHVGPDQAKRYFFSILANMSGRSFPFQL